VANQRAEKQLFPAVSITANFERVYFKKVIFRVVPLFIAAH
jgi:hypothetical protein